MLEKQFFSICCCASCKKNYFDLVSFEICWNTVRKLLLSHSIKKIKKSGKRSVNSYTKVCSMWLSLLVYYRRIIIVKNVRSTVPLNIDYKSKIFTDEKWYSSH